MSAALQARAEQDAAQIRRDGGSYVAKMAEHNQWEYVRDAAQRLTVSYLLGTKGFVANLAEARRYARVAEVADARYDVERERWVAEYQALRAERAALSTTSAR